MDEAAIQCFRFEACCGVQLRFQMVEIHSIRIDPPIINSSCAWSSDKDQLQALFDSVYTGAVTTRTATTEGFKENDSHTVSFMSNETDTTSINSYGYSPHPLSTYLQWVHEILSASSMDSKPFIISITSSDPSDLQGMVASIQSSLRRQPNDEPTPWASRIAIELNTSCPNISYAPPPAYNPSAPPLTQLLTVLCEAFRADPTLTIGLKLPPFVYEGQFHELLKVLSTLDSDSKNPIAFFTCTNTLGNSLLFESQTAPSDTSSSAYSLPTPLGGLAGYCLHPLALGNVHTFSRLLKQPEYSLLKDIKIIGVGGVLDSQAARRMRQAGADVVGAATLFGKYGVERFERLVDK